MYSDVSLTLSLVLEQEYAREREAFLIPVHSLARWFLGSFVIEVKCLREFRRLTREGMLATGHAMLVMKPKCHSLYHRI